MNDVALYNLVSQPQYESAWQALVKLHPPDEREYFTYHKDRYYELFDHLAYFLQGHERPAVLEVGVSGFTRLYKQLFPHISLVTLDRPVELNGASRHYALGECRADRHYNLDLNRQSLTPTWGDPPLGTFDYVVFCEVLEHLVINPVQVLEELISLLKPAGYLYLTTPNFFSSYHLQQIARGDNPQPIPPRRGEDAAASHHFREYGMKELVDFIGAAGGRVVKRTYSDCWDDVYTKQGLRDHPQLRSNLLLVAQRAGATGNGQVVAAAGEFGTADSAVLADNRVALQAAEIARLQAVVQAYENGKFIRLMRWLNGIKRGNI